MIITVTLSATYLQGLEKIDAVKFGFTWALVFHMENVILGQVKHSSWEVDLLQESQMNKNYN